MNQSVRLNMSGLLRDDAQAGQLGGGDAGEVAEQQDAEDALGHAPGPVGSGDAVPGVAECLGDRAPDALGSSGDEDDS